MSFLLVIDEMCTSDQDARGDEEPCAFARIVSAFEGDDSSVLMESVIDFIGWNFRNF